MSVKTPSVRSAEAAQSAADHQHAAETLPLDVVFDLLSNERRRHIVRRLQADAEPTTLGALAEHIAAIENDKPESALSSDERKRVYICLYQSHLPKMDDSDVIDFDGDRKTVEVGKNLEEVTRYLPATDDAAGEGLTTVVSDLADEVRDRVF